MCARETPGRAPPGTNHGFVSRCGGMPTKISDRRTSQGQVD